MIEQTALTCRCGQVALQVTGEPILTADCVCNSCREAAGIIGSLSGGEDVLDAHGGTRLVLYRKDRLDCTAGADRLSEFRLRPDSTTRRVVATCCNSAMLLDFQKAHWIDVYGQRWLPGPMPEPELRAMTSDLPDGTRLPDDIPNHKRQSVGFFAKLVGAWIGMRFRTPHLTFVKGTLDVPQS